LSEEFDYYEILEISRSSSKGEIKKAYRKMAMKYHPDKNPDDKNAEENFKRVNEAYQVLSDDSKKSIYDQYGKAGLEGQGYGGFSGRGSGGFGDLNDIFESVFGESFGGFGGGGRGRARRAKVDKYDLDMSVEITIEFNEAVFGTTKDISYEYKSSCGVCNGTGSKDGKKATCNQCDGAGQVYMKQGFMTFAQTCPACAGSGEMVKDKCSTCRGNGYTILSDTIEIKIPQGVDDQNRIRVSGKGNISKNGNRGDLYVTIYVKDDEHFVRSDNDIYLEIPVHFTQIALGATFMIPSLRGEVELKIPIGAKDKEQFVFRSEGVKDVHGRGQGNFIAQIKIIYPKAINKEQRKLLEELQDSFGVDGKPQDEAHGSIFDKIKSWFS
jgi:molecular chaperone DnaJ